NQVYHYSSSPSGVTFQAILKVNTGATPGGVTFNYPDLLSGDGNANGVSATVGIRAPGATGARLLVSQDGSNSGVGNGRSISVAVPTVQSITRMDPNPADAGDVHYVVTFSHPVTGVDVNDFTVTATGTLSGTTVHGIVTTPDPKVYIVHVDTGWVNGTVRLDLVDNDSIRSTLGARLGG